MAKDFADRLDTLARNLQQLDGPHHRTADEVFHEGFMSARTRFSSFKEMLDKSGCTVAQDGGSQLLPEDVWELHVQTHTDFSSWKEMQAAGAKAWLAKKAMAGV